jgi:N-acetylglucosamine-6-phosphate deacetylase
MEKFPGSQIMFPKALEHMQRISREHANFGTTRFLATFCTCDLGQLKKIAEYYQNSQAGLAGALALGCHLEGPFLNPKRAGAQPQKFMQKPSSERINQIWNAFGKDLRLMTLTPELPGIKKVIHFLKRKKTVLAMGHTDATYEEACQGIQWGIRYGTHLFNQMRGFHHRELGAAGAILLNDQIYAEIIADGLHLDPLTVMMIARLKDVDKIILATDCFTHLPSDKADRPPRLKNGALAGSSLSLRRAVLNLIKFAGVDLATAIHAATLNPARVLGLENRLGSLETGKEADVVLLDEKLNVHTVIIKGRAVKMLH